MLPLFDTIPDAGRVVCDDRIITGGGVTAGVDLALTMIAELAGSEVAQSIQLGLEYAPEPPFRAGRPDTAPPDVLNAYQARLAPSMAERRVIVERVASAVRAHANA